MTPLAAIARRRLEQMDLVGRARVFADGIEPALGIRAAVVVGSVARGDFNLWSDIDVIVVADGFADRLLERWDQLGERPPRVEPHPWTAGEWHQRRARRDPMITEALECGIWLRGAPADLG